MSGARCYLLYGLRVRSEVPLLAPPASAGAPDVEVRWGPPRPVPRAVPAGTLIARLDLDGVRGYAHTSRRDGFLLRYYRLADFWLSGDGRRVTVCPDPHADRGMVALLLGGSVMATVLSLCGHTVLHASCVTFGSEAIAFAGPAGSGKSTLAALCCESGALLVADDVLRVRVSEALCYVGSPPVRLRDGAARALSPLGAPQVTTADGRLAVSYRQPNRPPVLRAIVQPRPSRSSPRLCLERLHGVHALQALLAAPRAGAAPGSELLPAFFTAAAALSQAVPVYVADVPWGPPFPGSVTDEILDQTGVAPRAAGVTV